MLDTSPLTGVTQRDLDPRDEQCCAALGTAALQGVAGRSGWGGQPPGGQPRGHVFLLQQGTLRTVT